MQTPRRRILVDRHFQLQYALIWFWVALMSFTMLGAFYFAVRSYLATPGMEPVVLRMVGGMGLFVLLFCLMMGYITTSLTHRVAGAALNLQRAVERMMCNDLEAPVRLRPNDYLQALAGELDELRMAMLAQRDAALQVAAGLDAPVTDEQRAALAAKLRAALAVKPPPAPAVADAAPQAPNAPPVPAP